MAEISEWPGNAVHELRRASYQNRRVLSGELTDPVVFGDRPLWTVTLDWGIRPVAEAEKIASQISKDAQVSSTWNLYKSGRHGRGNPLTSTWGVQVNTYSYDDQTITFKGAARSKPGDLIQLGRWVIQVVTVAGAVVTFSNLPEALDGLTNTARNALVFGYDRSDKTNPLSITARVLDAQAATVEKIDAKASRVLPITIVEVA